MTTAEATHSKKRIEDYQKLESARATAYAALRSITDAGPKVCSSGPFTGNWRESRQVLGTTIAFSCTRGTAAPCTVELKDLHIEACEFGRFLEQQLQKRIDSLTAEMEKI